MEFKTLSESVLADVARCVGEVEEAPVRRLVDLLAETRRVRLIGTGRSGAVLSAMAVRLGHLGIDATAAGAGPGDLVLVGSGSGETPVPLEQVRKAKEASATIIAITAAPESSIAQAADVVIHVPALPLLGTRTASAPLPGTGHVPDGSEQGSGTCTGSSFPNGEGDRYVSPDTATPHTLRSLFEECLLIVCDVICRMLQDELGLSTDNMQARHSPDR
jgi:6-phospho-3-hexuloisomerase